MRVLGISVSHDAGVALVQDGILTHAVSEERFTRQKAQGGAPEQALAWIREELGGDFSTLDAVAIANTIQREPPPLRSDLADAHVTAFEGAALRIGAALSADRLVFGTERGAAIYVASQSWRLGSPYRRVAALLAEGGWRKPMRRYDHHLCHLLAATYTAGWDECLVVSQDFFGDARAGRTGVYRDRQLRLVSSTPMYHSVGAHYLFATNVCGFEKEYHCGKTTGLAALGDPAGVDYFRDRLVFDDRRGAIVNRGKFLYAALEEMRRELGGVPRETIAASVQAATESVVTRYIRHWAGRTGLSRVALTGGLFANVKLNQRIAELADVEAVFVHPHMGDGGLATGAAFGATAELDPSVAPYRMADAFLGPRVTGDAHAALRRAGVEFREVAEPEVEVARLLAEGNTVARVTGRLEYGPRALGHRSILYRATDPSVNQWLNDDLRRSEFMPFAPMVRRGDAVSSFAGYVAGVEHASEFMTVTFPVSDRFKAEAPAAVHVDGTARPQVVDPARNPDAHRILDEYERLTGLRAVINTSFNIHEQPIVRTAEEAVQAFLESGLDYLAVEKVVAKGARRERRAP